MLLSSEVVTHLLLCSFKRDADLTLLLSTKKADAWAWISGIVGPSFLACPSNKTTFSHFVLLERTTPDPWWTDSKSIS